MEEEQQEEFAAEQVEHEEPLLFIDVNLGDDNMQRITVMKGDSVEEIARQFSVANELDDD